VVQPKLRVKTMLDNLDASRETFPFPANKDHLLHDRHSSIFLIPEVSLAEDVTVSTTHAPLTWEASMSADNVVVMRLNLQ
jgi:hypothetical protein